MVCMMFNDNENIHPFYVEAENYPEFEGKQHLSTSIKDIQNIPPHSIKIPEEKLIQVLEIIKENNDKLTKKKMAKIVEENKIITVNAQEKNYSMARFVSIDKNIIQPFEEQWKFIKIEKVRDNR